MADALDQDVQALKEWLAKAWRYLAQPALTRFDRQEMRQQMKLVEAKLRIGLRKVAARDADCTARPDRSDRIAPPNLRLLNIEAAGDLVSAQPMPIASIPIG